MPEERFRIEVPGRGDVSAALGPAPARPSAVLIVAHGAGAGLDHPFLVGFTEACNELGVATVRFNFPYMEAGRRSHPTPGLVAGRARRISCACRQR